MLEINKIHCGDNVELLTQLDDNCIDLTVTSPPYDDLRTYNGYSFDFENVAKELYRVTKEGGVVVWVVGDKTKNGSESGTSFRQVLYFKDVGFNLHDTMIYLKENPVPQFKTKRYTQTFEYMFVFSKGKPNTCNYLTEKTKQGGTKHHVGKGQILENGEYAKREKTIIKEYKIKTNVWSYLVGTAKHKNLHPAAFPEKLAEDHIISWSNEGELILDPFMGSGTTAKMCLLNKRNYIGMEISQEYVDLANERISAVKNT